MRDTNTKISLQQLVRAAASAIGLLLALDANSAAPGITGPTFNLKAAAAYITQPDGTSIYSWGYGCSIQPTGFLPAAIQPTGGCPGMQLPGPTLIVTEGQTVSVTLTNNLPAAAGNTSILFPGFTVTTTSGGTPGLLTQEAAVGASVTYSFVADKAGTHSYYSGTQGDLQIEMGLYGAIIVLPSSVPANCTASVGSGTGTLNDQAKAANGETDFRLAASAYNHPAACYDREFLFQFSELDPIIHRQAEEQAAGACAQASGCMNVATEPYRAVYFLINGRSMPDNMDPHYAVQYPRQPYNGNPHMHPGELTLVRIIGHGRMQHPFHEHGNHVRVLARDGNLLLARDPLNPTQADPAQRLAGPLLFTTTTTPGQTMDGIFYWTGKGLNWDVYGHGFVAADSDHPLGDTSVCIPDANGYYTSDPSAPNYYEWCADHKKPLEAKPFGNVGSGGPVTLPDANILTQGAWYGGSPYLGPDAMIRAVGSTPIPPSGTVANSPTGEAGFAFMWHSHNEREITTNNIFPGGMLMMMLVDPRAYTIDESK